MKIITCAGYHGTGSSIVTDILKEFDNCKSFGEYEFRFIQDPYGIADLEYNLVENNHRLNSSNAIKKYKKNIDFLSGNKLIPKYEKYFEGNFKKISYEYIDDLTNIKYKAQWHQDLIEKGKLYYTFYKIVTRLVTLILRKIKNKDEICFELNSNEEFYLSYPEDMFYEKTIKYIDKLMECLNKENKEFLALDQLVPPSNCERYLKYFRDLKIIVVDRDPRDLFILEKKYWKDKVIPTDNISDFIEWYKITRKHIKNEIDNDRVLRVKFEDFIYDYENSMDLIKSFLNLSDSNHKMKKQFFNPEYL